MAYIFPAPGTGGQVQVWLQSASTPATGNLVVPALQDITINASNDVFTWTQLDQGSKQQVPTTATNDVSMNLVLDKTTFFGSNVTATTGNAVTQGVFGLSRNKELVNVRIFMGPEAGNALSNVTITCSGYVTGLAPAASADAPVFVSPMTLTISGNYGVVTNTAPLT